VGRFWRDGGPRDLDVPEPGEGADPSALLHRPPGAGQNGMEPVDVDATERSGPKARSPRLPQLRRLPRNQPPNMRKSRVVHRVPSSRVTKPGRARAADPPPGPDPLAVIPRWNESPRRRERKQHHLPNPLDVGEPVSRRPANRAGVWPRIPATSHRRAPTPLAVPEPGRSWRDAISTSGKPGHGGQMSRREHPVQPDRDHASRPRRSKTALAPSDSRAPPQRALAHAAASSPAPGALRASSPGWCWRGLDARAARRCALAARHKRSARL